MQPAPSDPQISHQQLERLAVGTVQQFAPPWTIRKLVLPDIPLETRIKWDTFLRGGSDDGWNLNTIGSD